MGLFGPNKNEIWKQLSNEINGEFIPSNFFKPSKVKVNMDDWTIVLDTHTVSTGKSSVTYTRLRAPFTNNDGFKFKIYREGIFSELGKFFGMQDIEIGDENFDKDFIIKSNNEIKVKELFSDYKIKELIEKQSKISLETKNNEGMFETHLPYGISELYFKIPGVIKDTDRLKGLFELFKEVLNEMTNIGITYKDKVDIELK